ncbi:response regulator transcription factor [Streptomyces sporangiiformans]|uniref:Response regulator transcription factor n=1 Tax=Streptomyces sporangiiformans TaxID=2315329 RepID=A0A505DFC6_9ACTN|nr:LuxR C-terminal-related transcriptional regulator [Streptomyces sporangiiformans]TPQ20335.1 response regulator transcription factor [Streptomyces sporangiiformans]
MRSSRRAGTANRSPVLTAPDDASRRLTVALACAEGDWPHRDWPSADDPYVGRALFTPPPHQALRDLARAADEGAEAAAVDVVVLHCEDPADAFPELLSRMGDMNSSVIVISPRRDTDTILEVFRGGAGYLVEGDYCTCMLSAAVTGAVIGHTYLSPAACAALREGAQRMAEPPADALERLRSMLSPRERQIMELLSTGLGAQEIGMRLRLSEKTVRNNLSNIYAKLDARGSTDAVLRWLGAAHDDSLGSTAR